MCFEGTAVQTPSTLDEPQRTKRQAISAEPSALDPSKLTDVMLTSYLKTKEWAKETPQTHTRVRARTEVTIECVCRSSELIQKALMNNDFMKHLEHGQVTTDPPHSSSSCIWAANWSALLRRFSPSWTACIPPACRKAAASSRRETMDPPSMSWRVRLA